MGIFFTEIVNLRFVENCFSFRMVILSFFRCMTTVDTNTQCQVCNSRIKAGCPNLRQAGCDFPDLPADYKGGYKKYLYLL